MGSIIKNVKCQEEQFNFKDAKGIKDFFKPRQVCHSGTTNVDPVTLKEMLQDILFGVNIIKGAFFKGENELEEEIASVREIKDNIDQRDNKLDRFIDEFNKGESDLSQDYPVKSKIIRKDDE